MNDMPIKVACYKINIQLFKVFLGIGNFCLFFVEAKHLLSDQNSL